MRNKTGKTAQRLPAVIAVLCLLLSGCFGEDGKPESSPAAAAGEMGKTAQPKGERTMSAKRKQWESPPEMAIDTAKTYGAEMNTNKGTIKLELYPEHAPKTVNNFVFLSNEGFYDGVSFHRVIPDFVIQGGDPSGTGAGGPGYRFEDETAGNPLVHETGVISMANSGPDTNGSQFFITHSPQPHLNGRHTVFGRVVEGMDVVNAIRQGDVMEKVVAREK